MDPAEQTRQLLHIRDLALARVDTGTVRPVVPPSDNLAVPVQRGVPNDRCWFCSRITVQVQVQAGESPPAHQRTREHLIPVSKGGGNMVGNVVRACRACNNRKGNRTLGEYRAAVWAEGAEVCDELGLAGDGLFWGERFARGLAGIRRGLRAPKAATKKEVQHLVLRTVRKWRRASARSNEAHIRGDASEAQRHHRHAHRLVVQRLQRLDEMLESAFGRSAMLDTPNI